MQQWNKTGKRESNGTPHACIPVSIAVIESFKTPMEVVVELNVVEWVVVENEKFRLKDKTIKIQTIISDYETMWCPRTNGTQNSERLRMEF